MSNIDSSFSFWGILVVLQGTQANLLGYQDGYGYDQFPYGYSAVSPVYDQVPQMYEAVIPNYGYSSSYESAMPGYVPASAMQQQPTSYAHAPMQQSYPPMFQFYMPTPSPDEVLYSPSAGFTRIQPRSGGYGHDDHGYDHDDHGYDHDDHGYDHDDHGYDHDDHGYDHDDHSGYDMHDRYGYKRKKKPKKEKIYIPVVKKKKKKMKIISISRGFYIAGGTQLFGKYKSLKKCEKACAATPNCFAGDYNPWLKKCYIHSNFTACGMLRAHKKLIHFKKVPCAFPEAPMGRVMLGIQIFMGIEQKGSKSLSDCIKHCATTGKGIPEMSIDLGQQTCFGIDYNFGSHRCYYHVDNDTPPFHFCPVDGSPPLIPRDAVANPSVVSILLCPGPTV